MNGGNIRKSDGITKHSETLYIVFNAIWMLIFPLPVILLHFRQKNASLPQIWVLLTCQRLLSLPGDTTLKEPQDLDFK